MAANHASPAASTVRLPSKASTSKDLKREDSRRSEITCFNAENASPAAAPVTTGRASRLRIVADFLLAEVDAGSARLPLAIFCFLSGFVGCVSFSACSIWVGYQTGNTVQSAIALSRLAYDPMSIQHAFRESDWQALCSILSFAIAAQFGGRLIPWSRKSRASLTISAFLQMVMAIIAAVLIHRAAEPTFSLSREAPSWHNAYGYIAIGLLSASFGLQGVAAEALGTGFTATVVLTSIWVQLALLASPAKWSRPRDDRIAAIGLFCLGAFVSRMLLTKIDSAGTLAVGAGLRLVLLPIWICCKSAAKPSLLPTTSSSPSSQPSTTPQAAKTAQKEEEDSVTPIHSAFPSRRGSRLALQLNDSRLTMVERPS